MNPSDPDCGEVDTDDNQAGAVGSVKPRLRGWLHAAAWPLAFLGFLVMLVVADSIKVRAGVAIFMVSALLLFGTSAFYHTVNWSEANRARWRRVDHANIFVLIAGSYTPFALLLLDSRNAWMLLSLVWGGALLGALMRVFWVGAPRWIYVPVYVALGWAAMFWIDDFHAAGGAGVVTLLLVGGVLYTLGALVYGFKRPDPWPRWFGFHEVFHLLTILAFIVHYVGVSLIAYRQH